MLHNLLLGVDGLDKLWTEEDYLSTWCVMAGPAMTMMMIHAEFLLYKLYRYADPDAELHSEFDLQTAAHAAIIEKRCVARSRQFRESTLGSKRPSASTVCPVQQQYAAASEEVVLNGELGIFV